MLVMMLVLLLGGGGDCDVAVLGGGCGSYTDSVVAHL